MATGGIGRTGRRLRARMRLRAGMLAVLVATLAPFAAADVRTATATVEQIRGHSFPGPVTVRTIRRDDLPGFLRSQIARSTAGSTSDYAAALAALQLIDDPRGVVDQMVQLYQSQVLAAYDPLDHVYYSIDAPPAGAAALAEGELLRGAVEIHELTHALQDQLFHAGDRINGLRGDWDGQLAYQAVLEGEATLVMFAWLARSGGMSLDAMLADDRLVRELSSAMPGASPGGVPPYFMASLAFPYVEGVRYVGAAYRRGGWKAVDEIDRNPPLTTAAIMGLPSAPGPPRRARADEPHPAPTTLLDTSIGAFHWSFLLGREAISGFLGDEVRVTQDPSCRTTVVASTSWTTVEAAERYRGAYRDFLASRGIRSDCARSERSVRCQYTTD
jgi:hypothetical protein